MELQVIALIVAVISLISAIFSGRWIMQFIETDNGIVKLINPEYNVKIEYRVPDWNDIGETYPCLKYKNNLYFLMEFTPCDKNSSFYPEFEAYCNESLFSGILIKRVSCEAFNVYTYNC